MSDRFGYEAPDAQRRDDRDSLMMLAHIRPEGAAEAIAVRVRNVSSGGLMAQVPEEYTPGTRVEVELEGMGRVCGSIAWAEAGRVGVAFDHPVDKARARKPRAARPTDDMLMRPSGDFRRPGLKPR